MARFLVGLVSVLAFASARASQNDRQTCKAVSPGYGTASCVNWAGTHEWQTVLKMPETESELADVVKDASAAKMGMRVIGNGHSWNTIAMSVKGGLTISLKNMRPAFHLDESNNTVTVGASMFFGDVERKLATRGFTLKWWSGAIRNVTVGGGLSVGFHGTQSESGSVASLVSNLRLVTANGTVMNIRRGDDKFKAMVVGLGCGGIITQVTMAIHRQHFLRRRISEHPLIDDFLAKIEKRSGMDGLWYWNPHFDVVWLVSFSPATEDEFNHDGRCHDVKDQLFLSTQSNAGPSKYGPDGLPFMLRWDNCTDFAYNVYTHTEDMTGWPFYNSEYMFPAQKGLTVWNDIIHTARQSKPPPTFWIESRRVRADDSLMGECHGYGHCWSAEFALTPLAIGDPMPPFSQWEALTKPYDPVLFRHGARPHWAKHHHMDYEYLKSTGLPISAFLMQIRELDPEDAFLNAYVRKMVLPPDVDSAVDRLSSGKAIEEIFI
mmetsp:Transcript_3771/g.11015  ORF Transcript_3771/g.11015 Transcript_3771/m.11015 type:complete len:491 (-) Transcript_3771:292-1764(-)|eukprot:CAMPEP_0168380772 /NCGR_PEP_ID=MMETSP0228-20121227/12534_1 /TAXON_ID=133427 /ORGANISM="Protoceratium reticulatum, Strain CCCM 535 (=CCMP 1889)" /LENGTH=490 /DNA_ID=CAMNT_0008393851 /DNA_START=37 /DNA_END=1509 /DNA_ORIENTATION=+